MILNDFNVFYAMWLSKTLIFPKSGNIQGLHSPNLMFFRDFLFPLLFSV